MFLENPAFVPTKKGPFCRKGEMTNLHSIKGIAPQTPENEENGGCHSGKGMA